MLFNKFLCIIFSNKQIYISIHKRIEVIADFIVDRFRVPDGLKKDLTKKERYTIFNKIAFLKKSLNNNFVFGGRDLLQKITREYNKKSNKV